MKRAAVLIGVDRTGDLPSLRDAAAGARRVEQWARAQAIDTIEVLTDENGGAVDIADVKRAIRRIVDVGTTEQLIVYFAGHGVNIAYHEYWLLTDAPGDPQAAVNVAGSELLARYCGIPHVLLISDACRTAADSVRAQRISGSEIFPNEGAGDLEKPVDQFFACTLGRPALEVRDPNTSAGEFSALYTGALLDGVRGTQADLLEWTTLGSERIALVHPRPLKTYLSAEVPRRIAALTLQTKAIQVPDAHIVSDPAAWVARLTPADIARTAPPAAGAGGILFRRRPREAAAPSPPPATAATVSSALLQSALAGDPGRLALALEQARAADVPVAASLAAAAVEAATPFGPTHHETRCGFKVRGASIVEAFSTHAATEPFSTPGEVVRVNAVETYGASVLLVFDSGNGVVLPAIPDFLAALTVEEGELVDVAYEPSDNTGRWAEYGPRADEIRALRAVASASTRNGVFRLEGDDVLSVARRMQFAKGVDPTLAIYAAYAYDDLHRRDLIRETSRYMRDDLGARFFDIALLGGELDATKVGGDSTLLSFVPVLAQGWALLGAHRVSLPESLDGIRRTLVPSPWTMFDPTGVRRIRAAMQSGGVR